MSTRIFGSGIRRREDPRLITGSAAYTDDLTLPRMVHAAMQSPAFQSSGLTGAAAASPYLSMPTKSTQHAAPASIAATIRRR